MYVSDRGLAKIDLGIFLITTWTFSEKLSPFLLPSPLLILWIVRDPPPCRPHPQAPCEICLEILFQLCAIWACRAASTLSTNIVRGACCWLTLPWGKLLFTALPGGLPSRAVAESILSTATLRLHSSFFPSPPLSLPSETRISWITAGILC